MYDGQAMDFSWDGKWTVHAKDDLTAKRWVLTFKLPYADYGIDKSVNGETWKVVVVRGGKRDTNDAVGLPYPSYHDIGSGADITFTEGKRPKHRCRHKQSHDTLAATSANERATNHLENCADKGVLAQLIVK